MYRTLNTLCNSSFSNAWTSSMKYPCPSLAVSGSYHSHDQENQDDNILFPSDPFFSPPMIPQANISNDRFQTREYYQSSATPPYVDYSFMESEEPQHENKIINGYCLSSMHIMHPLRYNDNMHLSSQTRMHHEVPSSFSHVQKEENYLSEPLSEPPKRTPVVSKKTQGYEPSKTENDDTMMHSSPKDMPLKNQDMSTLLPVMDCRFNMREMCKQSILLEDHLSHDEKRCLDCCMKHFLFLEGLCEEAITLDTEQKYKQELQDLCKEIRKLQHQFSTDPSHNAHHCSQELRKIRKKFQPRVFDMIFKKDNESCSGFCSYKPSLEE